MHNKTKLLLSLSFSILLTSCAATNKQLTAPISPLAGPPIQDTKTPYSTMLTCIGEAANNLNVRRISLAVNPIPDKTGKFNYSDEGYQVTQGAEDMMVSALAKTGAFTLVERNMLEVTQMEMQYANQFLLSDADPKKNVIDSQGRLARALRSGMVIGSDYVVAGSISEINYNIGSGGFNLTIDGIGAGWQAFWMDIGMDLRVINTDTTEIVMALPLRKQVWGYQNQAGIVHFFGNTYVNAAAGSIRQEPIELAVRSIIEDAVGDITKQLYHLPANTCQNTPVEMPPLVPTANIATPTKPLGKTSLIENLNQAQSADDTTPTNVAPIEAPQRLPSTKPISVPASSQIPSPATAEAITPKAGKP